MSVDNITSQCFYLLLAIYPFLPLIKEKYYLFGNVIELILIIMIFAGSFFQQHQGKIYFQISKNVILEFILVLIYALINSKDYFDSLSALRVYLLYIMVIQLFISHSNKLDNKKIINILMTDCIIISAGAIIQFIFPSFIKSLHTPSSLILLRKKSDFTPFSIYNRAISFMLDPNILSTYLCFNMFTILEYYKHNKKNRLLLFTITISTLGCLLSQSRTGIFAIVIYVFISFIAWIIQNHRFTRTGFLLTTTIGVIVMVVLIINFQTVLKLLRVNTLLSANGRVSNTETFIKTLSQQNNLKYFFGNGLTIGRKVLFENSFLLCFYTFGLMGSIIFCLSSFYSIFPLLCGDNWIPLISFLAVNAVGDYLMIPQVTMYLLIGFAVSRSTEKRV